MYEHRNINSEPKKKKKKNDEAQPAEQVHKHYFSPNRFYCVETICLPCGVVVAWTKFAKAESPTNIINWLEEVFPDKDTRPAYICIDKVSIFLI